MTKHNCLKIIFLFFVVTTLNVVRIKAEDLDSNNYTIKDVTVNSGGGITESTNYGILQNIGQVLADKRLDSANYSAKTGFPNSFQANIPIVKCFETNTTGITTDCTDLPNAEGMQGECGSSGCYDRAKLEIDDQNNPVDTLYLVTISPDNFSSVILYLQSDHTVSTTYDIADYMTQCQLEGKDSDDTDCDDSGDLNWNAGLQSYNIFGLAPDKTYTVKVRALHGDYTESSWSPTTNATTELPNIAMDLDTAITDIETSAPYSVEFGTIGFDSVDTAEKSIWVDITTNSINGINVYVKNLGNGLYFAPHSIPSESENLATPDSDGGYGLKIGTTTQDSLGPLLKSTTYDTAGTDEVGALSSIESTILYTNTTSGNRGPINSGRARILVKAIAYQDLAAGTYTDTITFTALGNW